jgi:hypothetical protein
MAFFSKNEAESLVATLAFNGPQIVGAKKALNTILAQRASLGLPPLSAHDLLAGLPKVFS